MRKRPIQLGAALLTLCGLLSALPVDAAPKEVFSGRIVSTDRNRYRMRLRTPSGRRVVWMQVENVWRGRGLVGRKILRPGMRVLVTAQRHGREWRASRVQVM